MSVEEMLNCPFCPFENHDERFLIQHVEDIHPENETLPPPMARDGVRQELYDRPRPSQGRNDADDYIECMCGEFCLSNEFDSHLDMHSAEGACFDDFGTTSAEDAPLTIHSHRDSGACFDNFGPNSAEGAPLAIHSGPHQDMTHGEMTRRSSSPIRHYKAKLSGFSKRRKPTQRLGKAELGPHADEDRMPEWLRKLLDKGAKVTISNRIDRDGRLLRIETVANEFRGIMPVISQLCTQDNAIARAYLCHPNVTHVVKMNKEGGFCGYRNIQMMISYIRDTGSQGYESFRQANPSILRLQDMIETAWDLGFGTSGRVETGGIRGTRKYIGTPEAQALFESLQIGCRAETFHENENFAPYQQLLLRVEEYFRDGSNDLSKKVCRTSMPPIYFQHPGHSLTIVGFERRKSGSCNLLVFDPMFQPSPAIQQLIGTRFRHPTPEKLLKAYRRGGSFLRKYKTFEFLHLVSPASSGTGWSCIR